MDLIIYWMYSNDSRLAIMPKNTNTIELAETFKMYYLSMTAIEPEYASSLDELTDITDGTDRNGLGIWWKNSDQPDAFTSPQFEVYCQTLMKCPDADVFRWLRWYISQKAKLADSNDSKRIGLASLNSSSQLWPRLKGSIQYDLQYVYSFFVVIPIVISAMPDFGTIMDEKDSRVAAFAFLNGCPESAYWLVMFITPFIFSFWPYFFLSVIFCFWFHMVGCDFSLMLVLSALFVASHILFQLWISTLIKTGAKGRSFTIVIVVFELFFAFVHKLVTLDSPTTNVGMKHLFSIIPFSCYQMIIGSYYYNGIQNCLKLTWSNMNDPRLHYQLWIGLVWLIVDCLLYLGLLALFNACMPRLFGTPIIKWSELFQIEAWKRAFTARRYTGIDQGGGELIRVNGLKKTYRGGKDVVVFDGVDFHVKEGEVIVIIGPNGAGKSTLVNILSGALEPDDGTLEFNGMEASSRFKVIQDTLGVVFQENIIFDKLSVREHLELFGTFKGISPENLEEAIDFFAENLQLTHMLNTFAGDLSGGQKRKLCISIALLGNPPIVIMDEPTAGVDVQARQLIWKTIASLTNTTSIVTSHALEEAETVSSRLFIVADHYIPFCGTSTELREKYKCGYLLRVDRDDRTAGPVLDLAQSFIPGSHLSEERRDTIRMPVDRAVSRFLRAMTTRKDELGINSFSFAVEQLEDMLLKMIETGQSLAVGPAQAGPGAEHGQSDLSEVEDEAEDGGDHD
jgi:ABC-type multidrug transport system ATPase subunit